jgi:hypothetical protein
MLALIENGSVSAYPYSLDRLKIAYPNTSFPDRPSDETLQAFNVYSVCYETQPSFNSATQVLVEETPIFDSEANRWKQVWRVRDLSAEELAQYSQEQASQIRAQRNELLSASDWTQVADSPVDKSLWAAYRQSLRDITQQSGFPLSVNWPTKP